MSWREQAACRGEPPATFYDHELDRHVRARELCAGCPVRDDCLDDVMTTEVEPRFGFRAGMTATARTREARRRGWNKRAQCGTDSGYFRHRRAGEPACDECLAAHAAAARAVKAARARASASVAAARRAAG